jgi:hypothetical protein
MLGRGAFATLFALISLPSIAADADSFPTLCSDGETTYLSARMATLVQGSQIGEPFKRNGKILSICTDHAKEPISRVVYRYGRIGAVELERVGSKQSPFFVHERSTSPVTGEEILFFVNVPYTYYVTTALGQGNGIRLLVFRGKKMVQMLFSGTQQGEDFVQGGIYLNFSEQKSPAFVRRKPIHEFE